MRILIVEDETAAYENLADMLVTIDPTLEIMGNLYYGVRSICDRRFQSKQHRLYLEAD